MRALKAIIVLLLCAGLCGCGSGVQSEAPMPEDTPSAAESTPAPTVPEEPDKPVSELAPAQRPESVEAPEPVYVYLPAPAPEDSTAPEETPAPTATPVPIPIQPEAPEDYIFQGYVEGEGEETLSKFQDLSGVENALALLSFYGNGGETVATSLQICGEVELCAFDIKISYDTSRLKYAGCENADDDLLVNCSEEKGQIMINFVRIVNLGENFKFCDLLFEVITSETCESPITIEVVEAVSLDAEGAIVFRSVPAVNATAYLNTESR